MARLSIASSGLRKPPLHRADHPLGVSDGRVGFLHRDLDGPVVGLVPPLEERPEQPSTLLVELATADQEVDEPGDDPRVLGAGLANRKERRFRAGTPTLSPTSTCWCWRIT